MINKQTKNYFSFPKGKLLFIFFFMLCFVVQFTIYSQTKSTIKGIVTDAQTNEPLLGANVIVIGTQIGAATIIKVNTLYKYHLVIIHYK